MEINTSRDDIYCPGDTISYNCSIVSNTETPHLIWSVILPGLTPINLTYDSTSNPNTISHIDMNISATLTELITTATTEFVNKVYIESIIVITVLKNVTMNGTKLECSILNLDAKSTILFVNTSGKRVKTCSVADPENS